MITTTTITNSSSLLSPQQQQQPTLPSTSEEESITASLSVVEITTESNHLKPVLRKLILTETHLIILKPIGGGIGIGIGVGGGGGDFETESMKVVHGSVSSSVGGGGNDNIAAGQAEQEESIRQLGFDDDEEEVEFDLDGSCWKDDDEEEEVVMLGKARRRTSSENDDDDRPPEGKRDVQLQRRPSDGVLGLSVRGGYEYNLPLIVTRIQANTPAASCKQIFIGDAIVAINGHRLLRKTHDKCLQLLNSAKTEQITLTIKHYPTTKSYIPQEGGRTSASASASATSTPATMSNRPTITEPPNLEDDDDNYANNTEYEIDKQIPLTFAILTRFLKGTDQLRVNSFQVIDCTGNLNSGVIYVKNSLALSYWLKSISELIWNLNCTKIKLYQLPPISINLLYINWIQIGQKQNSSDTWLTWQFKTLSITNNTLYVEDTVPGICLDWLKLEQPQPIQFTLLRVLNTSEIQDERQHCFNLQIAMENKSFPPTWTKPVNYYCSTETRQELLRVEQAWTRGVCSCVKQMKTQHFTVWWNGRPCSFELNHSKSTFNLYRSNNLNNLHKNLLWSYTFTELISSTDDSKTKLTLKFLENRCETMECKDLHRLLFCIHSFLLVRVVQ